MKTYEITSENLHVSARFHAAITEAAVSLEKHAAWDERQISGLADEDHRRRQRQLVEAQLEKAFRLREMLTQMVIRDDVQAHFVPFQ